MSIKRLHLDHDKKRIYSFQYKRRKAWGATVNCWMWRQHTFCYKAVQSIMKKKLFCDRWTSVELTCNTSSYKACNICVDIWSQYHCWYIPDFAFTQDCPNTNKDCKRSQTWESTNSICCKSDSLFLFTKWKISSTKNCKNENVCAEVSLWGIHVFINFENFQYVLVYVRSFHSEFWLCRAPCKPTSRLGLILFPWLYPLWTPQTNLCQSCKLVAWTCRQILSKEM